MRTIGASLCVAIAACAPLEPTDASVAPAPAAVRPRAATPPLVTYLGELRGMSEPTLTREIARQRQLLSKEGSDLAKTRLALALSLSPQGEDAEILSLVDPIARKESGAAEVRAMASFLHTIASERRRLRESAAAASAKARDERRSAESQKQRADTLQERATQLQQKIDALTELEKSLSDRPLPNR